MISFTEQSNDAMFFLATQMRGQAELERYLNEAILMSNGNNTVENMAIVNEGVIESVKEGLNKIAAFLKKMWNRFLEAMNNLVRTNKSYLDKYKDNILKNKIKEDVSYDMFNWKEGVPNIKYSLLMPYTNEDQLMKDFADKSAYIQKNFSNMIKGFKPPYDEIWGDICKAFFHGGQDTIEMKADELTSMLKDMYDYCYTYDTAVKSILEKDYNTFMTNAEKQLNSIIRAQSSGQVKESTNIWESAQYYSYIYESYVTEARSPEEIKKQIDAENAKGANKNLNVIQTLNKELHDAQAQQSKNGAAQNNNNNNQNNNGGATQTNGAAQNNNQGATQNNANNNDSGKLNVDTSKVNNEDELKKLSDAVNAYVNIGQVYLTNRMSAAEGAYKDFMKILREHVKDIVGNGDPAQKTAGAVKNDTSKVNQNQNGGGTADNTNGFANA